MKKLIINLPDNVDCMYTSIYEKAGAHKIELDYRWLPTKADITITTLTGERGGKLSVKEFSIVKEGK